jgi:hypothetical protein
VAYGLLDWRIARAGTRKAQLLKNVDRKVSSFGDAVEVALKYASGT